MVRGEFSPPVSPTEVTISFTLTLARLATADQKRPGFAKEIDRPR